MPAWDGGGGNLHLRYTLEMLGVTCVFKNLFFFFFFVHCLSDHLKCLWHIRMKGEEKELPVFLVASESH